MLALLAIAITTDASAASLSEDVVERDVREFVNDEAELDTEASRTDTSFEHWGKHVRRRRVSYTSSYRLR